MHDFWRPLDRKDALTDGHFSVQCYLDALAGAYQSWQQVAGGGAELVRTCYHVPYGKMARKAHQRRCQIDGIPADLADALFATQVEPSLRLPALVGNIYTGSLYLALLSLLHHEATQLAGQRIGLFSYGSGCAAEFFAGRVQPGADALLAAMDVTAPLRDRGRLTIPEYEALRQGDADQDLRPAPAGPDAPAPLTAGSRCPEAGRAAPDELSRRSDLGGEPAPGYPESDTVGLLEREQWVVPLGPDGAQPPFGS